MTLGQRIGANLTRLIDISGKSHREIAKAVGLSQPSLSAIANGATADPGISALLKICDGMKIGLDDLLGDVLDARSYRERLQAVEELQKGAATAEETEELRGLFHKLNREFQSYVKHAAEKFATRAELEQRAGTPKLEGGPPPPPTSGQAGGAEAPVVIVPNTARLVPRIERARRPPLRPNAEL